MKKTLWWIVINAGMAALVYAGFILGVEGAQYVVKFFVWAFCLPLGLISLTDAMQKKLAEERPTPIRGALGRLVAWCSLAVFVWTGHVVTAGAWALWMLCAAVARESAKKYRAGLAATTAT